MTSESISTNLQPKFLDAGDAGLVIELGREIDEAVNIAVVALSKALEARNLQGVREIVPTYRSLLVQFDPVSLPRKSLVAEVEALWPPPEAAVASGRRWRVPVLYGGEHGMDLEFVAETHGLAPEDVIRLHASADYRVYMIGFSPGFSYLGGLPEQIHTSRRTDPRLQTPPRSVMIGGKQAGISPPVGIQSGWHLLGQTPVKTYDPNRTERPFLFEPGDHLRFVPIDAAEYHELCAEAEAGGIVATEEVPSD